MFTRRFYLLFLLSLGLMLFFVGCQPEAAPVEMSPVEITESFYDWYLDYSWDAETETRRNPLSDGAYRDSIYLTGGLISQVDEVLASFDKGGFDPFLMAQDTPESFTVEAYSESAAEASTIVHALWSGSPSHDLMVDLVPGANGWQINRIRQGNPLTVEGATRLFFDSYIACVRQTFVDGAAEDCLAAADSFVTPAFVAQVEEIKADFDKGGYDPVLLAQDVPMGIALETAIIADDRATIVLQRYWGGNPIPTPMQVHLRRIEERWLVDEVSSMKAAATESLEPHAVVDAFYRWYLSYGGNPLADDAYEQSPYLTMDLMGHVAELMASFDRGGYDPFLCAQDRPEHIAVETVFMNDQTPLVLVASSFDDHFWTVNLRQVGDRWQISNVTCTVTPEGVAQAFYTWYLGNMGDRTSGEFRNLMVERAYRGSPFLSQAYVAEIDELLASFANQPGGYDPFLQAQDIPWAF